MAIINTCPLPGPDAWAPLLRRPVMDAAALEQQVRPILQEVREKGDEAVRAFSLQFDGSAPAQLLVEPGAYDEAEALVPLPLKDAIRRARDQIAAFHAAQRHAGEEVETLPGVRCWRRTVPIEKVGLYVPGGSAPLFSTVLMLGVPAVLAGCREILLCSPPTRDGKIPAPVLYAAREAGITRAYRIGGAQAIAAMAYGTASVPRVDKIFGPGNQYVTCAKQLVAREGVAMDMPAGPSELAVLADAGAPPAFVAADLLSQAEHGPDSQVLLVTDDASLADRVVGELQRQLEDLPRRAVAGRALEHSRIILAPDLDRGLAFLNAYAPEHLILACARATELAAAVVNAGSVFLGYYAPESAGDYASGTNHTLPTGGHARAYSGVSLDSFVRKITFQELSPLGLEAIADTVETMAAAEGLEAHRRAVAIRR